MKRWMLSWTLETPLWISALFAAFGTLLFLLGTITRVAVAIHGAKTPLWMIGAFLLLICLMVLSAILHLKIHSLFTTLRLATERTDTEDASRRVKQLADGYLDRHVLEHRWGRLIELVLAPAALTIVVIAVQTITEDFSFNLLFFGGAAILFLAQLTMPFLIRALLRRAGIVLHYY